ncbi:MAG: hypothetical protein ABW123_10940 [Cystobacter sp.]
MRRSSSVLLPLATSLALTALPASAESRNELSVGLSTLSQQSFFRSASGFTLVEASWMRTAAEQGRWRDFQFGGGVRTGWPMAWAHVPLELFVRAQLSAPLGPWEPAIGPELGVSGFNSLKPTESTWPQGEVRRFEDSRFGPAYLAFHASPLRFHLGRFTVSALQLGLGTPLLRPGSTLRVQLGWLSVGGWL